jgi:hypothetical protein
VTALESHFLAILEAHRGLDNAISVPSMAAVLGVSTRVCQQIKKSLVEVHHVNIGSSCGSKSGWFIPVTEEETALTLKNYKNRIRSLCILVARTQQAASLSEVAKQLALEFEQEDLTHVGDHR